MARVKIKIKKTESMEGIKIGLYIPSRGTIFVSPAVMKLCESDMNLMRKSLTVYKMPRIDNKDKFESIESWIVDLVSRGKDIFTKTAQDENKGNK